MDSFFCEWCRIVTRIATMTGRDLGFMAECLEGTAGKLGFLGADRPFEGKCGGKLYCGFIRHWRTNGFNSASVLLRSMVNANGILRRKRSFLLLWALLYCLTGKGDE